MKLSARNQLKGTVETVTEGAVNGVVAVKVGQNTITADITMDAIKDLGLEAGKEATVVVKATNVLLATGSERLAGLSARNQLAGTVAKVTRGAVNGHVSLKLNGGGDADVLDHQRGDRRARARRGLAGARHRQGDRRDGGRLTAAEQTPRG